MLLHDASGKTIKKKRELNMSTAIKNGKLRTINIVFLLSLFFIQLNLSGLTPYHRGEGKWVIVIDPGHGGKDPGALGSFSKEKDINLAIALKTGKYLSENLNNVNIIYTRKDDSKVDLIERPKIANENNADLFLSIHTNLSPAKSVTGAETFIMGLAKDKENLAVAMKENEVILMEEDHSTKYQGFDPKSPESYIIFTLMQNLYQKQSTDLASRIQDQFREKAGRRDRGVKQAGFWVLFTTTMPSVLIETGFISNPAEEKYLNTREGQDYIASAIYRACRDYIANIDMKSNISIIEPVAETTETPEAPVPMPDSKELFFTVQVATAATKTQINPENFKGLTGIFEISLQDRFKYATGSFKEYEEAVRYRKQIESVYPDAFVIAVKDNKIVSLQQVLDNKKDKKK